ncbi:hypothetical protein IRP63_12240 [Clostridium botulinum]|uniref:RiboL-PSP-HEPN domain-containing protein n=1 Tax=Clostridium botulinum C/D str. DC5 TaxID=1443128 RepID=A0A0A0IK05_CLOBO|nr:hypothetical protein [Clostridium botulinum]KGN00949.1 hypothetical protein Z955_02270 [Clostridium botulinum C/D str. DC5]KOC52427.1 hypothetical protein ADU89_11775 [Clostridium botulinum]KOC55937.1 hypothetical protein ADU90_09270 [Clostridium botulinum]MCD3233283.1 hypothetical protein [Clostridium botulinum D/C]MCD3239032.1 hypothetical protein [Clostridium botulinum D/C]
MAIEYSTIETIQSYDSLFEKFCNNVKKYEKLDKRSRLIYLTAGLGLSNSIHEKFIKSILYEYMKVYELSNRKKEKAIKKYKTPKMTADFIQLLHLNLNEAFELNRIDIQKKFNIINSVDNLMSILSMQRDTRNDYLHGDFNFYDDISFETFKENIIDFQEVHSFILKITRYSFLKNINNLPDISTNL